MERPLFVIIHGSMSSPESNWFPEQKNRLERLGQEVVVPQFPVDTWDDVLTSPTTNQTLDSWLAVTDPLVESFAGRKVIMVGHSLGPLFILHMLERYSTLKLDSLIAVSPFLNLPKKAGFEPIQAVNATFYKDSFDFPELAERVGTTYVLYSENDPYVPKEKALEFATKLRAAPIMVRGAGHMNAEANMNEFPLVVELCKSRIDLTLYQKYLDH